LASFIVRLGGVTAHALFALAVLFAVFAPTMDALAKEDALEASPSVVERMLAAFDVVDDVLDHMQGNAPAVHQYHFQSAPAPADLALRERSLGSQPVSWPVQAPPSPPSAFIAPPDHPPRS
jgi:ABC-type uncharacterized transport system permease subunit